MIVNLFLLGNKQFADRFNFNFGYSSPFNHKASRFLKAHNINDGNNHENQHPQ